MSKPIAQGPNALRETQEALLAAEREVARLTEQMSTMHRSVVHECCEAVEQVKALCARRNAEHFDFLERVERGEVIMMDRAIGPAQVLVREVEDALVVKPVEPVEEHRLIYAPDTDDQKFGEASCSCGARYPVTEERLRRSTPRARAEEWHTQHRTVNRPQVPGLTPAVSDDPSGPPQVRERSWPPTDEEAQAARERALDTMRREGW